MLKIARLLKKKQFFWRKKQTCRWHLTELSFSFNRAWCWIIFSMINIIFPKPRAFRQETVKQECHPYDNACEIMVAKNWTMSLWSIVVWGDYFHYFNNYCKISFFLSVSQNDNWDKRVFDSWSVCSFLHDSCLGFKHSKCPRVVANWFTVFEQEILTIDPVGR